MARGENLESQQHFENNPRLSDAVEGALQAADISGHYMGVDLRGLDIRVAEQFLEGADIDPFTAFCRPDSRT